MAKNKNPTKKELSMLLSDRYKRWEHIREYGSDDPFWPDGMNMDLVRNHIMYYKKQCEEFLSEDDYPEEYYLETPTRVDMNYMAREQEIREKALMTLSEYKKDKNYKYLLNIVNELNQQQKERTNIEILIRYVEGLEKAIVQNKLIEMRRQGRLAHLKEGFAKCRKKIEPMKMMEEQKMPEPKQLSLFYM